MAQGLLDACEADPDAVLAALHLERQQPYLAIQQLLGATLVDLTAQASGMDSAARMTLACAALTRDLGLLPIQAQLDQQAQLLSPEQKQLVQSHPERSVQMLCALGVSDPEWLAIVRQHHERAHGSGYPQQLRGPDILWGARLLSIADSYGAMVTPRSNRKGLLPRDALKTLFIERMRLYDDALVQLAIKTLTMHPPGSLARLSSGELVVVRSRRSVQEEMDLWCLYDRHGMPMAQPRVLDTLQDPKNIARAVRIEECRSVARTLRRLWLQEVRV